MLTRSWTRLLVIVAALACFSGSAWSDSIIVSAVQPLGADGETDIERIGEAHGVRLLFENMIGVVSGASIVGHNELLEKLGPSYLVDLFSCNRKTSCIRSILGPLQGDENQTVVFSTYEVVNGNLRFTLYRFGLGGRSKPTTNTFAIAEADIKSLEKWRQILEPIVGSLGGIRIVTNAKDYNCTIDGRPCTPDGQGVLRTPVGSHVIELSAKGYLATAKEIEVTQNKITTATIALSREAILTREADPQSLVVATPQADANRNLAVSAAGIYGAQINNLDRGNGIDDTVFQGPKEWGWGMSQVFAFAGLSLNAGTSKSGWTPSFSTFIISPRGRPFVAKTAALTNQKNGWSIRVGEYFRPLFFNDNRQFNAAFIGSGSDFQTGVIVSKSSENVLIEGLVVYQGLEAFGFAREGANTIPYVIGKVAHVDRKRTFTYYFRNKPSVVSLYGALARLTNGLGEADVIAQQDPMAVTPIVEELTTIVAGLEVAQPVFGDLGFVGIVQGGQNAQDMTGQGNPRVDPETGRHTNLRSMSGLFDLGYAANADWEIHAGLVFQYTLDELDLLSARNDNLRWQRREQLQLARRFGEGNIFLYGGLYNQSERDEVAGSANHYGADFGISTRFSY